MCGGIKVNEDWRKRYDEELMQLFGDLDILYFDLDTLYFGLDILYFDLDILYFDLDILYFGLDILYFGLDILYFDLDILDFDLLELVIWIWLVMLTEGAVTEKWVRYLTITLKEVD